MSQSDEDLIRELEYRFNAAWDRHEGLAEALTDDAHFITVNAAWTTSRQGPHDLMQRLQADRARAKSPEMHRALSHARHRLTNGDDAWRDAMCALRHASLSPAPICARLFAARRQQRDADARARNSALHAAQCQASENRP